MTSVSRQEDQGSRCSRQMPASRPGHSRLKILDIYKKEFLRNVVVVVVVVVDVVVVVVVEVVVVTGTGVVVVVGTDIVVVAGTDVVGVAGTGDGVVVKVVVVVVGMLYAEQSSILNCSRSSVCLSEAVCL